MAVAERGQDGGDETWERRSLSAPQRCRADRAGKLLVVDDDPEVRGMLSRLLEVEGYKVTEAMTGAEAIGSLANGQPDLVILDVMLTTEDGFDVLAAIRRTSDVPVILVTAKGHETDRVLGLKLGADDYVGEALLAGRAGRPGGHGPAPQRRQAGLGGLDTGPSSSATSPSTPWPARSGCRTASSRPRPRSSPCWPSWPAPPARSSPASSCSSQVWDSSSEWQDAGTVTEHIRRIRRKIEVDPDSPRWVRTVRGVGYRFEP